MSAEHERLRDRIAEIIGDHAIDFHGIPPEVGTSGGAASWYIAGKILALLDSEPEHVNQHVNVSKSVDESVDESGPNALKDAYLDGYREALEEIIRDPYGCRFCDSGVLRNPSKDHDDGCGFSLARRALEDTKGEG